MRIRADKRAAALLLALLLSLAGLPAGAAREEEALPGMNRCLLIGCDEFLSMPSTAPVSANNVQRAARLMEAHVPRLASLVRHTGGPGSLEEMRGLIRRAFRSAGPEDVLWLYISTHGITWTEEEALNMALLISDGRTEEALRAEDLREMLDDYPGQKVLILDACHAGAMIGKGVAGAGGNPFQGPDWRVLVSCGGSEESWLWSSAGDERAGGGYFTAALETVLDSGRADRNGDGQVALGELCAELRTVHGASTVYCSPEEDDRMLLMPGRRAAGPLENLTFDVPEISEKGASVTFRFTAREPVRVLYRMVFYRDGAWDFAGAVTQPDRERKGSLRGVVTPGEKSRTVRLSTIAGEKSGYALLEILTVSGGTPELAGSRVLCLPQAQEAPETEIRTSGMFAPDAGEELAVQIRPAGPCALEAWVTDEKGKMLKSLTDGKIIRPETTYLYWNGCLEDGSPAGAGVFRVLVRSWAGESARDSLSGAFRVIRGPGKADAETGENV